MTLNLRNYKHYLREKKKQIHKNKLKLSINKTILAN